jgi:hypothetical protein
MSERRGPHYVKDGWVVGHVQTEDPWPTYYMHQLEIVRPATIAERIRWFLFKTPPVTPSKPKHVEEHR